MADQITSSSFADDVRVESAQPPVDINREFPVPVAQFVATLAGTPDEVWSRWLDIRHGRENHTMAEWRAVLDQHRNAPAHPADPNYRA